MATGWAEDSETGKAQAAEASTPGVPSHPPPLAQHLLPLRPLLGSWRTEGRVLDFHGREVATIRGRDSWSVLPGGTWVSHESDLVTGGEPIQLHQVTGGSHPDGGWRMLSFADRPMPEMTQVTQPAPMTLEVRGVGTRGTFHLTEDPRTAMTNTWSRLVEGSWVLWMDITYRRDDA